jgi:predicted aspartyl protease
VFNLHVVDLGSLSGKDSFTLACTLRKAGIDVQVQALCDTGASGYVYIDSRFASDLCRTFGLKLQQLPHPILPTGYSGQKGSLITYYLIFIIEIDGRQIYNLPMLVTRLGSHDMIIGKEFLYDLRVLIDVFNRRLCWPKEFIPNPTYSRTLTTFTREAIRPAQNVNQRAQQDMFRRDMAIARDDKRRRDGVQIKVLTHELAKALPGPGPDQRGVVCHWHGRRRHSRPK